MCCYYVSQKSAPFYFCTIFVKPSYISIIFGTHISQRHIVTNLLSCALEPYSLTYLLRKFPTKSIFHILYKVESREPAVIKQKVFLHLLCHNGQRYAYNFRKILFSSSSLPLLANAPCSAVSLR